MKIILSLFTFLYFTVVVVAQTPFNCEGKYYISFYNVGATTTLNEVDILANNTATFTPVGSEMPFRINSVGYRVTDNFIYGIHPSNDNLYRIDATGTATFLYELDLTNNNNYVAGDVTPDGNYLVVVGKVMNNPANELTLIDLNSPTFETTSLPLIEAGTGLPNSTVNMADIAFNPVTGICYTYDSTNKRLVTVDIQTGEINSTLYPPTTAAGIGALFFDPLGQLWAYGRYLPSADLEDLISINLETGETSYVTTGPGTNGIDGCSCPYTVDLGKEITLDTVHQCESFQIIYPISNLSGTVQSGVNFVDTLPLGFIIEEIINNPFGGTPNGLGTNQLNIDEMVLPIGVDSLIINVVSYFDGTGYFSGHAHLSDLPAYLGDSIMSDNPATFQVDDETGITAIPLDLDLGEDIKICDSDTMLIIGTAPLNGFTYQWNTEETTSTININQANEYILTATTDLCSISDTIDVSTMLALDLGTDTTICVSEEIILNASDNGDQSYQWSDGSSDATLVVTAPGTYSVTVTDSNCSAIDNITFTEGDCDCIYAVPNAFTPNADGRDDYFFPLLTETCAFASFEFLVFDRWGDLVYEANSITTNSLGWNGTKNGQPLSTDGYIWIWKYQEDENDPFTVEKGNVTLIR